MFRCGKFTCVGCYNTSETLKVFILDVNHLKGKYSVPLPDFALEYTTECLFCGMIDRVRVELKDELSS